MVEEHNAFKIIPATTATVDMNSNKIINVTDPTSNQDAATKKYVDDIDTANDSALTTHEADTSTHGVTTIAGISETQTLTNKK